jgi:glycosyltransferase involved in cell wall biosynthesis
MTSPFLETLPDTTEQETPTERPRESPRLSGRVLAVARWPVGGIRTHLLYNYPALAAVGFGVTVVGPDDGSLSTLREGLGGIPGAEVVGVPVRRGGCRLWPAVRRLLRGGRFGLLHSHGTTAAAHGTLARLGLGVPHVVTLHEPFRAGQFSGVFGRARRWLLGGVLRRADALITVSDDARDNLLEHLPGVRPALSRIMTIPNGIDTSGYTTTDERSGRELRRRLGVGPETTLIGFLGRFMPEKGFPVLLDAVRGLAGEVPPGRFHLAAFGSGDYRREYRRRLDDHGLGGVVTLLDFVPDVRPVLRQLDLVVVPSLWEASSLVSMEAMAAGVPVLGSDCSGLREVLRGTPSRTVAAGDANALRHGLRLALDEPWTDAAREYAAVARRRFDNAPSARRLAGLIDALARRVPLVKQTA